MAEQSRGDDLNGEPHDLVYAWVAVGVAVLASAAFCFRFWSYPGGPPESWGQFGDFLGGIVNPAVGIVTAFLVVRTLRVTRKEAGDSRRELEKQSISLNDQLKQMRDEAQASDVRREIDGIVEEFRKFCLGNDYEAPLNLEDFGLAFGREINVTRSFAHLLEDRYVTTSLRELAGDADRMQSRYRQNWARGFAPMLPLLAEVGDAFQRYEELAHGRAFTDFTRRRLAGTVSFLFDIGVMHQDLYQQLRVDQVMFRLVEVR